MIFRYDIVSYLLTKPSYIILLFITRFCLTVLLFLCVVYCIVIYIVQCVHIFYIVVRKMPCMGRSHRPVCIFPFGPFVFICLYCVSNKVVKLN